MNQPDVTVIVCSYNRAESLRQALQSLTNLQTDGFVYEVLVVDNASTDHTPEVAKQAAQESSTTVRYVLEKQPGVSFARNRGVREAHGTWLAFFDDDEVAEPDWLIKMLRAADEHQVKCVGGGICLRLIDDDGNPASERQKRLRPWIRVMFNCTEDVKISQYDRTCTPGTGNLMIHRAVLDKVGLFRTDLVEGGEDTELFHRMRKAGFEAHHEPEAIVYHRVPEFRLEPKYIKLASLRMGSHIARREYQDFSWLTYPVVIAARAAQTGLLHGSRLLLAKASGDPEAILERQSKWWLGQGYLRAAFGFLWHRENATSDLEFRSERKVASPP